jgi:hypothetical protein
MIRERNNKCQRNSHIKKKGLFWRNITQKTGHCWNTKMEGLQRKNGSQKLMFYE